PRSPASVSLRRSVTTAVQHMRAQIEVLATQRAAPQFCSIMQTAPVCDRFFEAKSCVELYRDEPARPSDSGWFIGCDSADHDHDSPLTRLGHLPLYAVAAMRPAVVPYLALPFATAVHFGG